MTTDWIEASPVGDLLVRAAATEPDRDALVFPGDRYTYSQLLEAARHVSRGLWELGVRPGDHVGLLMPNCPEFAEAFFGVSLMGCVAVPINARYKLAELGYVIENADLVAILTSDVIAEHVDFTDVLLTSLPSLASSTDPTRLDVLEAPRLRSAVMLRGEGKTGFLGRQAFDELAARADVEAVEELRHRVRLRGRGDDPLHLGHHVPPEGLPPDPRGAVARLGVAHARAARDD